MNATELVKALDAAKMAALQAAEILEGWRGKFSTREKGRADFVTDADLASQQAIRAHLLQKFPDHAFLGEEDGPQQARPGEDAPPTWIVDPIDGTMNYVHDIPAYCVSIGLEVGGELVVGVVFDPRQREMFAAARGQGATLNGKPIRTSSTDQLKDALLSTGFPPDLTGQTHQLEWWTRLSYITRSLRRTGSTALNLAYVAAGRFDGYYCFDNSSWDVAGGTVLIREAGGSVTAFDGGPYDWHGRRCLASNGPLQPHLIELFKNEPVRPTPC